MKTLVNMCVSGMLALVVTSGGVLAQSATSAEARLKEKNIALPPVPPPVANYVELCASRKIVVSCRKHRWGRVEVQGEGWHSNGHWSRGVLFRKELHCFVCQNAAGDFNRCEGGLSSDFRA